MRDLQHGSMLDPHGQSNVGTMWELYRSSMGKINPHFQKKKKKQHKTKKKTHFYTNDYVPSPSPFDGLVRSQMREAYVHVQVIAHAYNQDVLRI